MKRMKLWARRMMTAIEYNSYQSGLMADAVAEWLNSKNDGQQAAAHSLYIKKFTIRWTSDSPELSRVVYKYEVNAQ